MPAYKAPLRDIRFLMNEVFDYSAHYKTLSIGENADAAIRSSFWIFLSANFDTDKNG